MPCHDFLIFNQKRRHICIKYPASCAVLVVQRVVERIYLHYEGTIPIIELKFFKFVSTWRLQRDNAGKHISELQPR